MNPFAIAGMVSTGVNVVGNIADGVTKVNRAIRETKSTIDAFSNNATAEQRPYGGLASGQQGYKVPPPTPKPGGIY